MATINYEPHVLLRWGGRLGEDTWSNGLRIRHPDQDPAGMIAWSKAHLGAITDVVKSWHRDTVSYHNGLATLAWVKLNAVGSNGRYLDVGQTTLQEVQPAQVPNGSPPLIAPQLAWAVTLRTAKKRGRAHAGRIYVPTRLSTVTNTGVVPASDCAAMASRAATFIAAVGDADLPLDGTWVGVFSPIDATVERVRSVDVGNVLDTQQRRRRQIRETYSNSTNVSLSAPG